MIRKFIHGFLILRYGLDDNAEYVANLRHFRHVTASPNNQVYLETNPLVAPTALSNWMDDRDV